LGVYPVCHFACRCYVLFRPYLASLLIPCGNGNLFHANEAGNGED
jgi:hypothetical protein